MSIILKMKKSANIFEELVQKVHQLDNYSLLMAKQMKNYDLQPYKIEQCEPLAMLRIYQNLQNKYKITSELSVDENSWNQNQRRLFVWFIICYCYFAEINTQPITQHLWDQLSLVFFNKKPQFLHFQYLNLILNKKRIGWTEEEDTMLISIVDQYKPGKWNEISKNMFYVSNRRIFRSPKHCRERWLNHLDLNKKHGSWSKEQDLIIFKYVCQNGKRWSRIVPLMNQTRTQHMIKNRYNSVLSKTKANKKQKQEEIANKIYKQLMNQQKENDAVDSKTPILKNQMSTIEMLEQQSEQQQQQNLVEVNYPTISYPPSLNYSYYYDYNGILFINPCYLAPSFNPNYYQDKIFSKNSCFTPYRPLE